MAADLHISSDGRFLYGSERAESTISAFAIDPRSGALSHIQTTGAEKVPRSFAIDPSGRFLVSAGQETGRIGVHSIDPTSGRLTDFVAYDAGEGASWVEIIDPSSLAN
jgi:6-phosphogluconolactonase